MIERRGRSCEAYAGCRGELRIEGDEMLGVSVDIRVSAASIRANDARNEVRHPDHLRDFGCGWPLEHVVTAHDLGGLAYVRTRPQSCVRLG